MNHPDDRLSSYVDGVLSAREATDVAAHLAECPACRDTVADLLAVRRLLAAAGPVDPPRHLLPRLLAIPDRPAASRPRVARWVVAAAGLALAALLSAQIPQLPPASDTVVEELQDHARLTVHSPVGDPGLASFVSTLLSERAGQR